jgi:hypothetical protein
MIKDGTGKVPGLLTVLAAVPDPRRPRGRRCLLAFVLAVAAACTLAGAKTFREIGGQAADLPQNVAPAENLIHAGWSRCTGGDDIVRRSGRRHAHVTGNAAAG